MLIYIATYPRSGNSWLRTMIGLNWRYLTSNGYPDNWETFRSKSAKYGIQDQGDFARYKCPETGDPRLLLMPQCLEGLTPEKRKALAQSHDKIFIKTHEMPFDKFYSGEVVIQMIRNPLDVYASYVKLQQDYAEKAHSAEALIRGAAYGTWAEYHRRWTLCNAYRLRLSFEDTKANEAAAMCCVQTFLGLPDGRRKLDFLADRQAANPERYSSGQMDRWRGVLTDEEADLVWHINGELAERFGYSYV